MIHEDLSKLTLIGSADSLPNDPTDPTGKCRAQTGVIRPDGSAAIAYIDP